MQVIVTHVIVSSILVSQLSLNNKYIKKNKDLLFMNKFDAIYKKLIKEDLDIEEPIVNEADDTFANESNYRLTGFYEVKNDNEIIDEGKYNYTANSLEELFQKFKQEENVNLKFAEVNWGETDKTMILGTYLVDANLHAIEDGRNASDSGVYSYNYTIYVEKLKYGPLDESDKEGLNNILIN